MTYLIVYIEALFMYFVAYLLIRLNRKGIGEQTTYDYTLLIILGTVAANPLGRVNSLSYTLVAMFGLWTGHKLAVTAVRINFLRSCLQGKPRYLIDAGVFKVKEFYSSGLTVSELYSELRLAGHASLTEIQWSLIEPSGKISFIPKANLAVRDALLVEPIIIDGVVQTTSLESLGKSICWLELQLAKLGHPNPTQIVIAELYNSDQINVIAKFD